MKIQEKILTGINYFQYRDLISELLKENKTTGNDHSQKLVEFTKLNVQRMNKWDKIVNIKSDLTLVAENLKSEYNFLILVEAWCGDCAQNVPIIAKIAEVSQNKIILKIIIRDENPEIMDHYLTNGSRSVPKVVIFKSDTFEEVGIWGPRPKPAQEISENYKANKDTITWEEFEFSIHSWYAKDKGIALQDEFLELLKPLS